MSRRLRSPSTDSDAAYAKPVDADCIYTKPAGSDGAYARPVGASRDSLRGRASSGEHIYESLQEIRAAAAALEDNRSGSFSGGGRRSAGQGGGGGRRFSRRLRRMSLDVARQLSVAVAGGKTNKDQQERTKHISSPISVVKRRSFCLTDPLLPKEEEDCGVRSLSSNAHSEPPAIPDFCSPRPLTAASSVAAAAGTTTTAAAVASTITTTTATSAHRPPSFKPPPLPYVNRPRRMCEDEMRLRRNLYRRSIQMDLSDRSLNLVGNRRNSMADFRECL